MERKTTIPVDGSGRGRGRGLYSYMKVVYMCSVEGLKRGFFWRGLGRMMSGEGGRERGYRNTYPYCPNMGVPHGTAICPTNKIICVPPQAINTFL